MPRHGADFRKPQSGTLFAPCSRMDHTHTLNTDERRLRIESRLRMLAYFASGFPEALPSRSVLDGLSGALEEMADDVRELGDAQGGADG
jgi:hypothetical protein